MDSFKRGYIQYLLLFLIVLVAFILRMATFKFDYFLAYDPAHHYKIAEYILENGEFPILWHLSSYPFGSIISEPMGLYYVSVILYKVLNIFGLSFFQVFKLAPPIFSALTLVPMYLITRDVFSKRAGFYAIIILAFLPANIHRTVAGYYRGDAFFMFFVVLSFYLFIKSIKDKSIPLTVLAGLSFGLMGLVWNGYLFGFVIVAGFIILYSAISFIQGKSSKDIILKYVIFVGIGMLIVKYSMLLQPTRWDFTRDLVLISGAALFVSVALDRLRYNKILLPVLIVISLALAWVLLPVQDILQKLLTGYGLVKPTGFPYDTITELKPITEQQIWYKYRLTFILFPLGFIYLLKESLEEKSAEKIFLLVWVLASFYLLHSAVRYAFISSVPLSIIGGLLLYRLEDGKILQPKQGAYIISASILVSIAVVGTTYAYGVGPAMSGEWYDAITELKDEEMGSVLIWWDYGSWIQGMTGFPTMLDGVHGQDKKVMRDIGIFFKETNESKSFEVLRKYHVKYVVVPTDTIRQLGNVLSLVWASDIKYTHYRYINTIRFMGEPVRVYSSGENKRFYVLNTSESGVVAIFENPWNSSIIAAMEDVYYRDKVSGRIIHVKHTPENISKIFPVPVKEGGVVFVSGSYMYHFSSGMKGTLLTSLLFLDGKDFESYKRVFSNRQVKIYRPIYNYTWIEKIRTSKLYYKTGEEVDINVQIESTLPFNGKLGVRILDDGDPWTTDDDTLFYKTTYDVEGNSSLNLSIAVDTPGLYKIESRLYEDNRRTDFSQWYFRVD